VAVTSIWLFDVWVTRQKSVEQDGIPLYSVEETNYTKAYGWFTSYPKLDVPVFDERVAKLVNDAKGIFLARVNLDAQGSYPKDDLNISYTVTKHDDRFVTVIITERKVVSGLYTAWAKKLSYGNQSKQVDESVLSPDEEKTDAGVVKNGTMPHDDTPGINCKKEKCIALTFDGGPSYVTPQLLDTLTSNRAKATFFEVGAQAKRYPKIAKHTAEAGNSIGNGTYDYRNLLSMPLASAKSELESAADAIEAASGVRPGIVRAPYGSMTSELAKSTSSVFVGWTADQLGWQIRNTDKLYDLIMSQAKPGAILRGFDIDQVTVDAYKRAISHLVGEGYALVTVPQLLQLDDTTEAGVYIPTAE
jgi:peptidoglycan/xylan/chitin deacetylase (PgdA/CDA1 family)